MSSIRRKRFPLTLLQGFVSFYRKIPVFFCISKCHERGTKRHFLFPQLPFGVQNLCTIERHARRSVHATSRCRKLKKIYSYMFIYIFIYVSMPVKRVGPKVYKKKSGMSTWL